MNGTIEKNEFNKLKATSSETTERNMTDFCYKNRTLPSVFIIGIQKCGTSTLNNLLSEFRDLSNGGYKEHHFFDNPYQDYDNYTTQFPECNQNIVRTYDATPNYTNPLSSSAENIARFYKHFGLDPKELIFIAMVCSNARRIPSAFYHESRYRKYRIYFHDLFSSNSTANDSQLNAWFKWAFTRHLQNRSNPIDVFFDPSPSIFRRGYYDLIFNEYFKIFPDSRFLFIDSEYAFIEMQKLGYFLAKQLNLFPKNISYINDYGNYTGRGKLTILNLKLLKESYSMSEKRFIQLVNLNANAKTFPANNFMSTFS